MVDYLSTRSVGMRDDSVMPGVAGTDNAAILAQAFEDCANQGIPFLCLPNGGGGRFYISGNVPIPSGLHFIGRGGKLLNFGRDADCFTSSGTDIIFDDFLLDGDLSGGSAAPEVGTALFRFLNSDRVKFRGGRVNCWNGGWGLDFEGNNEVESISIDDMSILATATDTAISLASRCDNSAVRNCVVTGDKNRIAANNVYVDDRIMVAFTDLQPNQAGVPAGRAIVTGNRTAYSHSAGVKVGGLKGGIVGHNYSYCTGWGVDAYQGGDANYTMYAARQILFIGNVADGSRVQNTSTSGHRFSSVRESQVIGCSALNSQWAQAEPDAGLFRWGFNVDTECLDMQLKSCDTQGTGEVGFTLNGSDIRLIDATVRDSGGGAVQCIGGGAGGVLEIVNLRTRDLFKTDSSTYRVIEINGATGLEELRIAGTNYSVGTNGGVNRPNHVLIFNNTGLENCGADNWDCGVAA